MSLDGIAPTPRIYQTLVSRYAEAGSLKNVRGLVEQMEAAGVQGDAMMWGQCVAVFGRGMLSSSHTRSHSHSLSCSLSLSLVRVHGDDL